MLDGTNIINSLEALYETEAQREGNADRIMRGNRPHVPRRQRGHSRNRVSIPRKPGVPAIAPHRFDAIRVHVTDAPMKMFNSGLYEVQPKKVKKASKPRKSAKVKIAEAA